MSTAFDMCRVAAFDFVDCVALTSRALSIWVEIDRVSLLVTEAAGQSSYNRRSAVKVELQPRFGRCDQFAKREWVR